MRNTVPENVAEHSYFVAVLAHALCTIGREMFGRLVDTDRVVTLALFHDASEVITGDVPTPVKHHNSAILAGMREVEVLASERLLSMVPHELKRVYQPLLQPLPEDAENAKWVKAADKLAGYLKCLSEVAAGNREFAVAKNQLERQVRSLRMPEVDYFLTNIAPSFEQTLDEISE